MSDSWSRPLPVASARSCWLSKAVASGSGASDRSCDGERNRQKKRGANEIGQQVQDEKGLSLLLTMPAFVKGRDGVLRSRNRGVVERQAGSSDREDRAHGVRLAGGEGNGIRPGVGRSRRRACAAIPRPQNRPARRLWRSMGFQTTVVCEPLFSTVTRRCKPGSSMTQVFFVPFIDAIGLLGDTDGARVPGFCAEGGRFCRGNRRFRVRS